MHSLIFCLRLRSQDLLRYRRAAEALDKAVHQCYACTHATQEKRPMTELSLSSWSRGRHQLAFSYSFEDLFFSSTFWYEGADFYELEERYGAKFMQRLYFHIAAFDINKVVSLRPDRLSWGPFADFATPEFASLWRDIFKNVWAQWRYQNDDPEYFGPSFEVSPVSAVSAPVETEQGEVDILAFCGGGKDSLVAMKLLERGGGGQII